MEAPSRHAGYLSAIFGFRNHLGLKMNVIEKKIHTDGKAYYFNIDLTVVSKTLPEAGGYAGRTLWRNLLSFVYSVFKYFTKVTWGEIAGSP
jgi:hypothetical protein